MPVTQQGLIDAVRGNRHRTGLHRPCLHGQGDSAARDGAATQVSINRLEWIES